MSILIVDANVNYIGNRERRRTKALTQTYIYITIIFITYN